MKPIAHTKNALGKRQDLVEHLHQVADAAARYAASFHGERFARYAGWMHDIGKYDPAFQQYLLHAEQHPGQHTRGPDHKGAGTMLAATTEIEGLLAFLIAGHHGGLPSLADLTSMVRACTTKQNILSAIAEAKQAIPELQAVPGALIPPSLHSDAEKELFTRMVFSALVDADFLDTEQHFNAGQRYERGSSWTVAALGSQFEAWYRKQFACVKQTELNTIRAEIYQQCINAAQLEPGFFRLAVPTGGGKTLSSAAFAFQHARHHRLERVIYAIPYTSIIDQTARIFRSIFPDDRALIEHHSDILLPDPEHPTPAEIRRRLAAENWDAPLIITTTVQLFESLLGRNTSICRKLHNIARSVIILDEVHMLPMHVLTTILDVLRQLIAHYGVSVVLCTATQPDFTPRQGFEGLPDIRDLVPEPQRYFTRLKRVVYQVPAIGETWTWEQVAARVEREHQILVVVNSRRDAASLLQFLTSSGDMADSEDDLTLFHLSTRLCGAHRRKVLEEVHRRLLSGEPCRLIATQVVEAGVDLDFPIVMRAVGPLDRIVQAAGRANREGKRPHPGTVIVFVPADGHLPKGSYTLGTDITRRLLQNDQVDLDDPQLYQAYFRDYYSYPNQDPHHIEAARKRLDYPLVAEKFRMIEDTSIPVIVPYDDAPHIASLLESVRHSTGLHRDQLRALQPYTVNLLTYEAKKAQQQGLLSEVIPGLWEWCGRYDSGPDGKHGQGLVFESALNVESMIW